MIARVIAVVIILVIFFSFIIHGETVINERFTKLFGKTTTTIRDQLKQYLEILRDESFKLPMVVALMIALLGIARLLVSRRRLLGIIKIGDFQKHLLLFGPTGSGKTSTALRAIELSLKNNVPVEVLDWKGEYVSKIRGATVARKINLLEPPDWSNVENHVMVIVDILRDVLQLTDPMGYMLFEELSKMYEARKASFRALMEQLRSRRAIAIAQRYQAEANIAEGLIRRILPLVLDEKREAINIKGDNRAVIYDLSDLPTYQSKVLYSQIIMWRIFNDALKSRSRVLKKLIVAEESQNYVRSRRMESIPTIGERAVNELRAYGYGFILISPDPSQLPYHMTRDCGAIISIGYQALPEIVMEFLNNYRYVDVQKLIKAMNKPRMYVYYNGRLCIKKIPKPYRKVIKVGVESVPCLPRDERSRRGISTEERREAIGDRGRRVRTK